MEAFGFGLGVVLATLGPLLLLPAAWLLQRLLRPLLRRLLPAGGGGSSVAGAAWITSALLLAAALAATWYPGHADYARLCLRYATPQIAERVDVDGFYRERLFPYQSQRLFDQGFAWIETEDPQWPREKRLLRYRRDAQGTPTAEPIAELASQYGVREQFEQVGPGLTRTEKRVYDRRDGRLLARAGQVTYDGGPLALFLGAYAVESCPDVRAATGSRAFRTFYDLEAIVLGGRPLPPAR